VPTLGEPLAREAPQAGGLLLRLACHQQERPRLGQARDLVDQVVEALVASVQSRDAEDHGPVDRQSEA
jgi:hypothetical protein